MPPFSTVVIFIWWLFESSPSPARPRGETEAGEGEIRILTREKKLSGVKEAEKEERGRALGRKIVFKFSEREEGGIEYYFLVGRRYVERGWS